MQNTHRLLLSLTIIVIAITLVACGGSSSNTGTAVTPTVTATSAATATPTPSSHFKVGQTVKVGNTWEVTIASAKTSQGSDFLKPQKAGDTFLVFSINVKNISSKEQDFSTYLFRLRDTSGKEYNQAAVPDPSSSTGVAISPSGKVEPGGPLTGLFGFEVPTSIHQFALSFEAVLFSPGQTIWDIHV